MKQKQKVNSRFYIVEEWMRLDNLDIYHRNIIAVIYGYTKTKKKCFVTNQQFAEIIGASEATVARKISDLVKMNYIINNTTRKGPKRTVRSISLGSITAILPINKVISESGKGCITVIHDMQADIQANTQDSKTTLEDERDAEVKARWNNLHPAEQLIHKDSNPYNNKTEK